MKKWIWVVLAAIMAVMCAGVVTVAVRTVHDDAKAPRTTALSNPPSTVAAPPSDGVSAFGANHGFAYDDGLRVSVVSVKRYRPTQYAILGTGKVHLLVTVQITNNTGESYDPTYTQVTLAVGPSGTGGSEDIDSQSGVVGATDGGSMGQRRTKTFKFGFAVPAALNPVQVTVTPDFSHAPALFEGKIS